MTETHSTRAEPLADPERPSRDPIRFDGPLAGHAVEVAPRIWWVGNVMPGDPFQTHAYLIEAGNKSVLVDPGSELTIDGTLTKLREVIDLRDIATILLHHSDPDCADAIHRLGDVLDHDVDIVTEWRSELLLRHLNPRFPVTTVEDLGWQLELEPGRELKFLLTPYLHFPGAFVTFDTSTRSLLTADLFGGFNNARRLWATGIEDFEDLRAFHEHYMPSREILMSGLATIRSHFPTPEVILPQHGYLIPRQFVDGMFDALFRLDCGVMLMSRSDTHLARLIDAAAAVRQIEQLLHSDLGLVELMRSITVIAAQVLPVTALAVERDEQDGSIRSYDAEQPEGRHVPRASQPGPHRWVLPLSDETPSPRLVVELSQADDEVEIPSEIQQMFTMLLREALPVVERLLDLHVERQTSAAWRHTATHDSLTGLESRSTLDLAMILSEPTGVLMIDLDEFKQINDTWGHQIGDDVLRALASTLQRTLRPGDRAIRYGGEEITVLAPLCDGERGIGSVRDLGERLRAAVENIDMSALTPGRGLTVSIGATLGTSGAPLHQLVQRADDALYRAKRAGRNRVEIALDQ